MKLAVPFLAASALFGAFSRNWDAQPLSPQPRHVPAFRKLLDHAAECKCCVRQFDHDKSVMMLTLTCDEFRAIERDLMNVGDWEWQWETEDWRPRK